MTPLRVFDDSRPGTTSHKVGSRTVVKGSFDDDPEITSFI